MCIHTRDCCRVHGCKYGDSDCPVYLGFASQEFACEYCGEGNIFDDGWTAPKLEDVPKIHIDEFRKRREYAENLRIF